MLGVLPCLYALVVLFCSYQTGTRTSLVLLRLLYQEDLSSNLYFIDFNEGMVDYALLNCGNDEFKEI